MAALTDSAEEAEKFSWSCLPGGGFVILRQPSERHRELQIRFVESQRDSGLQLKVARDELPWVSESNGSQPQRGCVPVFGGTGPIPPFWHPPQEQRAIPVQRS